MSIFSITISFNIEDIHCYYLCEHTHKIFKDKKDKMHDLMIAKNIRSNEMVILCKTVVVFYKKTSLQTLIIFSVTLKKV